MSLFGNGEVSRYLSALPEQVTVPSFPGYRRTFYVEKDMLESSVPSFGTFWAANGGLQSTSNLTSDLCIDNGLPNGNLSSSESHIIAHSSYYKSNPGYPKLHQEICWGEEPLPGVSGYPASIDVSYRRDVIVSPQNQDTTTVDHDTHLANQNEWFSSGISGQFLENSGPGGSVLKEVDATSTTPSSYAYFHGQNDVSRPFDVDELCSHNSPSLDITAPTKSRMRWSPELHEQFVDAVNKLGGGEKATPKAVQKIMKVEGLTIYQVKSHLQKYRTVRHRSESSDAGTSTEISSQMDEEFCSQNWKSVEASEGLRTQIGLQKQLHEQLEIQRKLQLQVEEHSKYLEMVIVKQGESLKLLAGLPRFQHANTPSALGHREEAAGTDSAEESPLP